MILVHFHKIELLTPFLIDLKTQNYIKALQRITINTQWINPVFEGYCLLIQILLFTNRDHLAL